MAYRQRKVEDDIRQYVVRYKLDNLYGVGIVPAVDVHEPCWRLDTDGTAQRARDRIVGLDGAATRCKRERSCRRTEMHQYVFKIGDIYRLYGTCL